MRIFMLSWEYPPRIVGGLARHVEGISRALVSLGHEVHVVTLDFPGAQREERDGAHFVHRVEVEAPAPDFHAWVLLFNHFFEKRVGQLARHHGLPDIVHVHDWLTVPGGIAVKHLLRVPLVMTFHSTEASRSSSIPSPESSMVQSLEWWGSFEAAGVIAVSAWMRAEVASRFRTPEGKVIEIPNGVEASKFSLPPNAAAAKRRWGMRPEERLITAVGRLTSQKGFDDLIRAYPRIRTSVPHSRLLIMGDGYMRSELEELARRERVDRATTFAGFVSDADLIEAICSSDVVVVPSRFEPFGIIALEAMAAGVPVVVSRVGGLAEIVEDRVDGMEVEPNDPASIAEATIKVLNDGALASALAASAREKVKRYSWESSARRTVRVYSAAIGGTRYE